MNAESLIVVDSVSEPYWSGLKQGRLLFQSCGCGHRWLPAARHCPKCLGEDWKWVQASGEAHVESWVVYHVAYHSEFKDKLPYNVAIVQLVEGPRMITNIEGDLSRLAVKAPVSLKIDTAMTQPLARFSI